jgi:hypothetical protein
MANSAANAAPMISSDERFRDVPEADKSTTPAWQPPEDTALRTR